MQVLHSFKDNVAKATNVLLEISIGEYVELTRDSLQLNPFQRPRIKTAAAIYSMLKDDLEKGIIIPPLVLGLSCDDAIPDNDPKEVIKLITEQSARLLILDGLQRTYTIHDLVRELSAPGKDEQHLKTVKAFPLRVEVYVGIEKTGILYRMLTLNTGQTPMSSRHQIEIIYSDYVDKVKDGIRLIRQAEGDTPDQFGEYNFRDVIDGFTSYLEREYFGFERQDILANIKSLEKLSKEKEKHDLFTAFVQQFHAFLGIIYEQGKEWNFDRKSTDKSLGGTPFGTSVLKVFNRSQVLTGFGAAIAKLIDNNAILNLTAVEGMSKDILFENIDLDLDNLIVRLDELRAVAKKIGNDQRYFFYFFFRQLFDKESESFLNFGNSIESAFRQYLRNTQ